MASALKEYAKSIPSMSSTLEVSILFDEDKPQKAKQLIEKSYQEAQRLINIISAWQEGTELYKVNENAGIQPVAVCDELFYLVKRSLKLSEITDGLFDVTFASIDKIWYFDRPIVEIPNPQKIAASIQNINYNFIELDEKSKTIFVKNKGTKIELGAIGKGFIANKMKKILLDQGVQSGLVNAGGDLVCWGDSLHPDTVWKIGISDPNKKTSFIGWLPIKNEAIATSGNYERFAIIDGEMYSHIINPKTGYPVKGIKSVTVLSQDPELCDVLATSIFLMGVQKGLAFVNSYDDIRCFIIDDDDNYHYSNNLERKYYKQNA
jgi:FAD:protein FMN transferase